MRRFKGLYLLILGSVVIGGGLSGLLIALSRGYTVIEEQPSIGGTLSTVQLDDMHIPFLVPLTSESVDFLSQYGIRFREVHFRLDTKKEKFLVNKVCHFCEKLPEWVSLPSDRMFLIENISEFLSNIEKRIHVIKDNAKIIGHNSLLTKRHGIIKVEENIVDTTSVRTYLKERGRDVSTLRYVSSIALFFVTRRTEDEDYVYIDGGSSTTFSHVFHLNDFPRPGLSTNYVYAFLDMERKVIDVWNVISDLKRERLFNERDFLLSRSRVIKEAILSGSAEVEDGIHEGRLGRWENYSIPQIVERYSHY